MKKKNVLFNIFLKIGSILLFSILCFFNVFQKLDYRFYDSLLHLRKEPSANENIMIVKIDDPSILTLGEWPWSRDIMADALLRMRELGAYNAIFDVEYISPSKNGIAPSAEEKIYTQVDTTKTEIDELVNQLCAAISNGYYSTSELTELAQQLIEDNINVSFDDLSEYIFNNMSRDNDEYFAQAIQFFGKAYLTINHQDLGYPNNEEELAYINSRLLLDTIYDENNLIQFGNEGTISESKEPVGFTPSLYKLLTRAYSTSFTNSVVDSDGVRRRMELLFKYGEKYVPQLAFGPYLDIVDSKEIERNKDYLIIKNAKDPVSGIRSDIKIPLDHYGRLLINYRKGSCDEAFKNDSICNLISLDTIEAEIINILKNISAQVIYDENGYELNASAKALELLNLYSQISLTKEALLSKCTGYAENGDILEGITDSEYKNYFDLRDSFYYEVKKYLKSGYLEESIIRLSALAEKDAELFDVVETIKNYMNEDFDSLEYEVTAYTNFIDEMKPIYKNAYCVIGNTATSTTDNGATPFEKKYMNVGIHANILNTLITKNYIYNIRWYYGFIGAVIISLLLLFLITKSNAKQNIITLSVYISYSLILIAAFVFSKYYIQCIGTMLFMLVDFITGVSYRFYESVLEKRFITQIAASFANKDTVEELKKNPAMFKTEGQKKCITALFSDIQKFSTLSESISKRYGDEGPNKLIEILNEYLGQMSNEILKNNGNIDKYEGDAIISMFGAPDPMSTHSKEEWAYLCLDSAIRMKKVEVEFNQIHEDLFKPVEVTLENGNKEIIKLNPLQTRIGVNSGEAFVGLMGSKTDAFSKLNYTMIGDTVNLASRLEGVNKEYKTWIMCSDETWNMANTGVHKNEITVRKLDKVRVVGRSTPVQLYNVVGFTNELSQEKKQQLDIFETALEKYLARDFTNAGKLFIQANSIAGGDPTALVFAERCKNFIQNGIPENWDGVINMMSK